MKLCFAVQLAFGKGGLYGEALYLGTEDAFRPERITQIAFNHFSKDTIEVNLLNFKIQEVLTRIHVRKINTHADDLYNIILNGELDSFLDFHSLVKLLILDSISYLFRYDYDNENAIRVQKLIRIASKLKEISHKRNIAVSTKKKVNLYIIEKVFFYISYL